MLHIDGFPDHDLHLDGRGLSCSRRSFCWQTPTKLHDPLLPPVLVYPVQYAPGSLRRASTEARSGPLAALLGSTRAAALEAIAGRLYYDRAGQALPDLSSRGKPAGRASCARRA